MLETLTRLNSAMPAFLKASSKLESFSRWRPTPFVRKSFFGTHIGVDDAVGFFKGSYPFLAVYL